VCLGHPSGQDLQSTADEVERRDDLGVEAELSIPVGPQRTTSLPYAANVTSLSWFFATGQLAGYYGQHGPTRLEKIAVILIVRIPR
jgi:hypothetical protein